MMIGWMGSQSAMSSETSPRLNLQVSHELGRIRIAFGLSLIRTVEIRSSGRGSEVLIFAQSQNYYAQNSKVLVGGQKFWFLHKAKRQFTPSSGLRIRCSIYIFWPSRWEERNGEVCFAFWQLHKIDNFGCQHMPPVFRWMMQEPENTC